MPSKSSTAAATRPPDWHLLEAEDIARHHEVSLHHGLHEDDAATRRQRHGSNAIAGTDKVSAWRLLLRQFTDFMILVLIAAAGVSALLGDWSDSLAIVVVVLLNGLVGFGQAWRADRALEALKKLAPQKATVVRQGRARKVDAHELVPGDVVLIEAGDQVPADLRLAHVARLQVDESALTGESVAVEKHADALRQPVPALGDRRNMAYKGTLVSNGSARALVVATGMSTELGKIAQLMTGSDGQQTPLQRRLADFGKRLALAVLAVCAVVFVAGLLRGEPVVPMVLTAISLAVAAIPEALPAVVTVLLALGARRMASLNALVRRLPSVETLGSVTFICSDKTGTLTQNRMHVEELRSDAQEGLLLLALALCNDAEPSATGFLGDPTETALLSAAQAKGLDIDEARRRHPRLIEVPFDSQRKRMTTLHAFDAGVVAYTKGAPEVVVPLCVSRVALGGSAPIDVRAVLAEAEAMASRGLRVLAVARRAHASMPAAQTDALETELQFIGLVGLIDPPRAEAAEAVRSCRSAGITAVMITGDHPGTALAIARRIGIVPAEPASGVRLLTGADLEALSDEALRETVRACRVYARVDPTQKIRLVRALQAQGEFVAMTGDGVNDAPALKQADVGVAMGRTGTDVARESASLVLLDDNFATIVGAVREGRRIYDNIRKFVRYAMTGNSGEIWTIFLAPLVGLPIPLLPIHILWVNLVTDGLPGIALAGEAAERGVMQRPPRPPQENFFDGGLWQHVLFVGLLIGGLSLALQAWALSHSPQHAQTIVFTALTLMQMAHVLGIRSEIDSLWRIGLGSNLPLLGAVFLTLVLQLVIVYAPFAQPWFKTVPLTAYEFGLCIAASLIVLVAVEGEKGWRRARQTGTEKMAGA
ncbi:cation-translocating P-type ATPase [Pelomonas sp. P7]|uniref:Cation-translocating P-type ATPase n=1 Tax=Pelomonas caseinilytica TaxID=2906763 RepID=A0ABS8XKK8_9BURK|nr:cation-translocating P-type ATPase [Pelomonas sp. P7]MCE4540293.1 cation-translocating P-type ATPase [Pelomonas sp. P7]